MAFIPYAIRDKHVHVIGKTGHGKSTLLARWIYEDIIANEGGLCVIDPKGDLVDLIAQKIPPDRLDDVIWTDIEDPLPIDFLSCAPGQEQSVVADLKYILTAGAVQTDTAPTLNANIENLLHTLLHANMSLVGDERCTFLDIAEFFEDPERQRLILAQVMDPKLARCWKDMPSKADIARILTRINSFVRNSTLSQVFGSSSARLNMRTVIEQKKILLVRVPVTHPFSSVYGALLVSKIQQAAFSQPVAKRTPFFLYIDEFQNFRAAQAFRTMLEMARSYKLCLTLANLDLEPLEETVRSALGIISTYILFRLSPPDASFYKPLIESLDSTKALREKLEKVELDIRLTPYGDALDRLHYRRNELQRMLVRAPPPQITILDALELSEFEAIYKIGNTPAFKQKIARRASPPSSAQHANFEFIKSNSKARWGTQAGSARIIPKRTGDDVPCDSPPVLHTEVNAIRNTDPTPSGPPNIPPYQSKKRKP
jgi:hypothetical protein